MNNLIINFTPNGIIPTKNITPFVPEQPEEIIKDTIEAYQLGITMVHLHIRDLLGKPSLDPIIYSEVIQGIREKAKDLVICISTSGRIFKDINKRLEPLKLLDKAKPDMASLTLSSLNFNKEASINEPQDIKTIAKEMLDRNIKPELEIFDLGMVNYMKYLIQKELLTPPYYTNIILGNIACSQANPLHLGVILNDLPKYPECLWSLGGIGNSQLSMNSMAISIGGGVRVGLEDNIWFDNKRTQLATNINLLKRIHIIAKANERNIMSPNEFRKIINIGNINN